MAESFLRRLGGDQFEAHSAGLEPRRLNPLTLQVMQEIGYPMEEHTSKSVNVYLGKTLFQYLITVCDHAEQNCPTTWPGVNQRLHWSFEGPAALEGNYQQKLARFREIRDQIAAKVQNWVAAQSKSPDSLGSGYSSQDK